MHYFTWKLELVSNIFVSYCLWKLFLILTRPRPIQTYFFDIFGNSKAFHTFNLKLEQLSGKEVLTFALLVNCFPDLFIAVEISY